MTDKVNEKTNEFDNGGQTQSDNPLEELAKIIGYQDDGQVNADGDGSANEAVTDLEAELLREFGVEPQAAPQPSQVAAAPVAPSVVAEPSAAAAAPSEPQANPIGHSTPVDDVLDDMSRYELPTHGQSANAAATPNLTPNLTPSPIEVPPVQAEPSIPSYEPVAAVTDAPVNEPAENVFEAPTMSRATPVMPQTPVEVPPAFQTPEQNNTMQPEPEVAELPNPLSTPSPFSSQNDVTPEENNDLSNFDLGQMSNDLEQELEKLQQGLEAGVNEVPEQVIAPSAPEVDFAPVSEAPVNHEPISAAPVNPEQFVPEPFAPEQFTNEPVAPVQVATDADIERPFPSVVLPQDNSVPPNFADLVANEEPVERTEELESVLDVSGFTETEADIEETAPFEIPELPAVEEFSREQSNIDVDLDLELEREFSQLISGDLPSEQEVQATAEPVSTVSAAASAYPSSDLAAEHAEMDELNELFNVGVAEAGADAAPQVNNGPDRIDVTNDADNLDEDIATDDEASGSGSNTLAVVGVLAALLLGGGAYLYFQNSGATLGGSNEPVIIKADNSPIKEVPADPGGASVPNQDQAVYEQVEGNDVSVANQSTLVKSTEEPVDIVQRTLNPSILPLEGRDLAGDDKNTDRLSPTDETAAAAQANDAVQPLVTPRRVQTVIVQSDGTIITREAPAPTATEDTIVAAPAAPATTAPSVAETPVPAAQPVETALATPEPTPAPTQETAPTAPVAQPETTAPLSNDTAAAIANAPVQPAQAASNYTGYYMQIASQPSLAAAESSYASLSSRFNSILGGLPVEYQTANIEGKGTFHRVRIQAGSRGEANSLCSRYKSAGGSCFVAR
ncbi:MAG: SPOR domain-containing protein [Lentilitoribacter sp.]